MAIVVPPPQPPEIVYPESDGKPMADNTLQFEWITSIKQGLDAVFRDDPKVFIAGDLLWYPVEGRPDIAVAPDVLAAFGRPKGYRGSYLQWREGGVPPQVVFEILSPNNTPAEMGRKLEFYEQHGVEEYYLYDPDRDLLTGWRRDGLLLTEVPRIDGWVSPRLGVRFDLSGETLALFGPDGRRFATYLELLGQNETLAEQNETLAEQNETLAEQNETLTERNATLAAQSEALAQRATAVERERDAERERARRMAERLRELGVDPEA